MKILFMGTPDFAVPCLDRITESHDVIGVFTQPDRPKGRGYKLVMPPVKEFAVGKGIQVFQPESLRDGDWAGTIREMAPDCIVVVAYGQILSEEILSITRYGCVNVHGSLLPKFRGASPIQWSIVQGEKVTGVTTMLMDKGLDTGDIIESVKIPIGDDMDAGELHDVMAAKGADLIVSTLSRLEKGDVAPVPQNDGESSYAPLLTKEMGRIDWNMESSRILCLIRGLNPWPVAHTMLGGDGVKVFKARISSASLEGMESADPGEVVSALDGAISVRTGDGAIDLLQIQLAGKKRMEVSQFLLGHKLQKGDSFK